MGWLTEAYAQQSLAWLLLSTLLAVVSGFLSAYLTYYVIKRKEIIAMVVADIQKQKDLKLLEAMYSKNDRIRQEVLLWANPILGAVQDLEYRLKNILDNQGYLALTSTYQGIPNSNWSISYDYVMLSSLYLFAQYFCWIRMLQEKLNFELFQSQKEKRAFFKSIDDVSNSLSDYPPNHGLGDKQIFRLQQRAIGEIMIYRNEEINRCLTYPEFIKRIQEDCNFQIHIIPLRLFLEDLKPHSDGRWNRLSATKSALHELNTACKNILELAKN